MVKKEELTGIPDYIDSKSLVKELRYAFIKSGKALYDAEKMSRTAARIIAQNKVNSAIALKNICCAIFKLDPNQFHSRNQEISLVNARQLYSFIRFLLHDIRLIDVAKEMKQNHATIYNSCQRILNYYDTVKYFNTLLNEIIGKEEIEMCRKKLANKTFNL